MNKECSKSQAEGTVFLIFIACSLRQLNLSSKSNMVEITVTCASMSMT
jgi:hypothetical protein